jgi:hypothetical protein
MIALTLALALCNAQYGPRSFEDSVRHHVDRWFVARPVCFICLERPAEIWIEHDAQNCVVGYAERHPDDSAFAAFIGTRR